MAHHQRRDLPVMYYMIDHCDGVSSEITVKVQSIFDCRTMFFTGAGTVTTKSSRGMIAWTSGAGDIQIGAAAAIEVGPIYAIARIKAGGIGSCDQKEQGK